MARIWKTSALGLAVLAWTALADGAANRLPAGFLSTRGGATVDCQGNVVRLEGIAWCGAEGPAGSTPRGVRGPNDTAAIAAWLSAIQADGFNTVRLAWSDANLAAALPTYQAIVAAAG